MLLPLLRLTRPANLVTAVADVLAGMAIAGYLNLPGAAPAPVGWLCLSTVGLYGGGVVFNDVFDADLDAIERPERPIPSGQVSRMAAAILGIMLLLIGVLSGFMANQIAGYLALMIAMASLVYDRFGKHHNWLGPLNMGLCRGLNLLLGISVLPEQVQPCDQTIRTSIPYPDGATISVNVAMRRPQRFRLPLLYDSGEAKGSGRNVKCLSSLPRSYGRQSDDDRIMV